MPRGREMRVAICLLLKRIAKFNLGGFTQNKNPGDTATFICLCARRDDPVFSYFLL